MQAYVEEVVVSTAPPPADAVAAVEYVRERGTADMRSGRFNHRQTLGMSVTGVHMNQTMRASTSVGLGTK